MIKMINMIDYYGLDWVFVIIGRSLITVAAVITVLVVRRFHIIDILVVTVRGIS